MAIAKALVNQNVLKVTFVWYYYDFVETVKDFAHP